MPQLRMGGANSRSNRNRRNANLERRSQFGELAEVLNFLMHSASVNVLLPDMSLNLDDDLQVPSEPPKYVPLPDSTDMKSSDISHITAVDTGIAKMPGLRSSKNTVDFLTNLKMGSLGGIGQRSHIEPTQYRALTNQYLPIYLKQVDHYTHKLFCGIFSPNGNYFATAAQDQYLRIYDSSDPFYKKLKKEKGLSSEWSILDIGFTPDENNVIYASWSENLYIWNFTDENARHVKLSLDPETRRFACFSLSISHDGGFVGAGGNDGHLHIYDLNAMKQTTAFEVQQDDVNAVIYEHHSTNMIYTAGDDGIVKLWDLRVNTSKTKPTYCGLFAGHVDGITCLDVRKDGRHVISNSKDQSIKLWDNRRFSDKKGEKNAKRFMNSVHWDYRWQSVPEKIADRTTKLAGDTSVMTYRGHAVLQTLIRAHFSPHELTGSKFIYTGCAAGRVLIYDLLTGKIVKNYKEHRGCVRDVSWHPLRNEIVSSAWDCKIFCYTNLNDHSVVKKIDEEVPTGLDDSIPTFGAGLPLRRSNRLRQKNGESTSATEDHVRRAVVPPHRQPRNDSTVNVNSIHPLNDERTNAFRGHVDGIVESVEPAEETEDDDEADDDENEDDEDDDDDDDDDSEDGEIFINFTELERLIQQNLR